MVTAILGTEYIISFIMGFKKNNSVLDSRQQQHQKHNLIQLKNAAFTSLAAISVN